MEYWYLNKSTGVIYAYPTPKARYYSIRATVRSGDAKLENLELWETSIGYSPRLNIRSCPARLRIVLHGDSRIALYKNMWQKKSEKSGQKSLTNTPKSSIIKTMRGQQVHRIQTAQRGPNRWRMEIEMNTTTKKERLLVLNHYYSEHPPKDRIEMGKLFYDVEQAINWKDGVEPDGYIFDFYDYFATCIDKEA